MSGTMRALVLRRHGTLQDLEFVPDYPRPSVKDGHVVIRVRASSPASTRPMPVSFTCHPARERPSCRSVSSRDPRPRSSSCVAGTRLARMEGHAVISHEVLAAYAADAAREVVGVRGLVDGPRRHHGVRIVEEDGGATSVELYLATEWGTAAPDVATAVQARVAEYLARTAALAAVTVDVIVASIVPDGV